MVAYGPLFCFALLMALVTISIWELFNILLIFFFSGAMAEEEKKKHAGDDFEKSIRNVMDAQKSDFSKNFPKSKKLPGIVRSLQDYVRKL